MGRFSLFPAYPYLIRRDYPPLRHEARTLITGTSSAGKKVSRQHESGPGIVSLTDKSESDTFLLRHEW